MGNITKSGHHWASKYPPNHTRDRKMYAALKQQILPPTNPRDPSGRYGKNQWQGQPTRKANCQGLLSMSHVSTNTLDANDAKRQHTIQPSLHAQQCTESLHPAPAKVHVQTRLHHTNPDIATFSCWQPIDPNRSITLSCPILPAHPNLPFPSCLPAATGTRTVAAEAVIQTSSTLWPLLHSLSTKQQQRTISRIDMERTHTHVSSYSCFVSARTKSKQVVNTLGSGQAGKRTTASTCKTI